MIATASQRDRLLAEMDRIKARCKKRVADNQRDSKRIYAIESELNKLKIVELVGVANAVQLGVRYPANHRCSRLNNLKGTVNQVRRTKASVTFENGERWSWHLENLQPAGEQQGFWIPY